MKKSAPGTLASPAAAKTEVPPRESFPIAIGDAPDHLELQIVQHHYKGDDAPATTPET